MRIFRLLPLAAVFLLLAPGAAAQDASRVSRTPAAPSAAAPTPAPAAARSLAPVLAESFNDVTTLPGAGWSLQNLSTPVGTIPTWIQGDGGVFPAQAGAATAYIGASYNSVAGANTISNWLLTPQVALANGTTLTFYTRTVSAPAYPDRLEVRLSTNGSSTNVGATNTSVGDFTTVLLTVNPTLTTTGYPSTWTQYTVTLSGLPSPLTGRFAFRYFVTNGGPSGANSDFIGLDEVVVESPGFAFVQPTMGQEFRVGSYLKAIWESPDPAPATVTLSLRKGMGTYQVIYSGPNLEVPNFGAARYLIPAGMPAGSDYNLRIEDASDPTSFAVSGNFSIADPAAGYTFTSPVGGETYAIGSTQTGTWTSPAGASGTTVTVTLHDKATGAPLTFFSTADDGSETLAIPPIAPAGVYYLTVVDDGNPAYTGRSGNFRVATVAVPSPAAGSSYSPGATLPVTWEAPTIMDATAVVRIVLRSASTGKTLLVAETENDGAFDATIPAGQTSASDYTVSVRLAGDTQSASGVSGVFSIGGEMAAPATSHFVPTVMQGSDVAVVRVEAPGLADGAEVGVFLGERLLGAAVVAGGTAEVVARGAILVPALVVDGRPAADDFVYVADGMVLSLRAFDGVTEQTLETTAPVTFAGGIETTVTAKGGAAAAASSALRVSAFPNPATSSATVRFETAAEGAVAVEVFDVLGRRVATLAEGTLPAGTHAATWDASAAGAGVYVVRVVAAGQQATARLSVVR